MIPIRRRPLDLLLVLFFSVSVLYGFLFSLPEGLGVPVAPDSPWPPLRALHGWAVAEEPAHLDPPPSLIASCLFDGLFQAPVLLFVVYGLVRLRGWLRPLGLVYAGAATTNMFFYFTQTFLGPHPPPNVAYYLAFNLPWLVAPLALGVRVLPGRDVGGAGKAGVSTWAELEEEAPEIAQAGRRLLPEVAFLATVGPDGAPRVHPFCPALARDRLWAFVMSESPKRRDLDANGRFAIHALPGPEDEEFYIAGAARRVGDRAAREAALAAMPYDDADEQHLLYEFLPDRALWTTWENFQKPGMRPVHRVWRCSRNAGRAAERPRES